jgi:tRNA G18 (ribose-2'-O)-methylase SpoU
VAVDTAARDGLLDDPVAFLVGAEGPGLDEATIGGADAQVSIPMDSGVDSLNAATALAVVGSFAAARRGWS